MVPTFPSPFICRDLWWAIPWDVQNHPLLRLSFSSSYLHISSVATAQLWDFCRWSALVALHSSKLLGQILDFLPSHLRIAVFCTVFYKELRMVTSSDLLDSRCYKRTLHREGSYPNSCHTSRNTHSTCPLGSDLFSLSDHRFTDDKLSWSSI